MYSIKHFAELLNYPNTRERPPEGYYWDIWDGKAISSADILTDDIVLLNNYDPFSPFGLTTKYSCATFTSKITNVPLGIRHLPFWHLPSVFINGPVKSSKIRPYILPLVAEAQIFKKNGNFSYFYYYFYYYSFFRNNSI